MLKSMKTLIVMSCIALFLGTGYATRPLNPQAFDPRKCAQSVPKVAVCLTDMWTKFGRPSAACCKALGDIDDSCMPTLFPTNPFIAPFLENLCSVAAAGGSGGGMPFPFFPFPPFGGGLPFPFPFAPPMGGGGGLPFPFPFAPPMGGGGASAPPPKA